MSKNCYLHLFLEESNYKVKQRKISRYIIEDINFFSDGECDDDNGFEKSSAEGSE